MTRAMERAEGLPRARWTSILALILCAAAACHGADASSASTSAGTGGSSSSGQSTSGGPTSTSSSSGSGSGGSVAVAASCTGAMDTMTTPVSTALPKLPELTNVRVCTNGGTANVTFDALDPARDYRIYPLPADQDITVAGDGSVVVKNAIYRCSGHREALYMLVDKPPSVDGWNDNRAGGTTILNGDVEGYMRAEADATLGYVYQTAGAGRVPVYVVGLPDTIEVTTDRAVFASTRPKAYTTDAKARDALLATGARDDGIAFYVPAAASADTRPLYEGTFGDKDVLRWIDGPEGDARSGKGARIFDVLKAPSQGAVPLMRVHEIPYYTTQHDELAAGAARYAKVRSEGDPLATALHWAGITKDTILVVDALDGGCPYQGNLSTEHESGVVEMLGTTKFVIDDYTTIQDMHAASPTGEAFVNGQFDGVKPPKAIARSFVSVKAPAPAMLDFVATFPENEDFRATFGAPAGNVYGETYQSPSWSFSTYNSAHVHFGSMLGEFWASYNDLGADVNGKVRLTPNQKASLAADSYLHVTTEVDILSTQRRYPQIFISDQSAPVQDNLPKGTTLVVQPKEYKTMMQVQVCDHRTWDVNNQCPLLPTLSSTVPMISPILAERISLDATVKIDVYVSTQRLYLMIDDQPYSCTDLSAMAEDGATHAIPAGPVSVTWGDVLYHSDADLDGGNGGDIQGGFAFVEAHLHRSTRRHFGNLGWKSGSARPEWDESKIPCVVK